jgi:ureidoacrylate peracid hydrolase
MIRSAGGKLGEQQTVDGTWGWENIDAVKPMPGDWIVRKHRRDGFWASDLDALLRWNGIKTIVFVGIGGELGGVATLITADTLGYFRIAVKDGILTSDPGRTEDAWRFISDHAVVKTSAEVLGVWNRHAPVTH